LAIAGEAACRHAANTAAISVAMDRVTRILLVRNNGGRGGILHGFLLRQQSPRMVSVPILFSLSFLPRFLLPLSKKM
jgi:hypothetical protein